jgi:hypothetical protein
MHMDISQGNFYAKVFNAKGRDHRACPDLTLAFNTYRKNPSVWNSVDICGYTVWGSVDVYRQFLYEKKVDCLRCL